MIKTFIDDSSKDYIEKNILSSTFPFYNDSKNNFIMNHKVLLERKKAVNRIQSETFLELARIFILTADIQKIKHQELLSIDIMLFTPNQEKFNFFKEKNYLDKIFMISLNDCYLNKEKNLKLKKFESIFFDKKQLSPSFCITQKTVLIIYTYKE